METSVKGIRYTYQVDLFNQVPTTVKSKVHRLPNVTEMSATNVDHYDRTQDFLPPENEDYEIQPITHASPDLREEEIRPFNPGIPKSQEQLIQPINESEFRIEPAILKQVRQYRQQEIAIPPKSGVSIPKEAPVNYIPDSTDTNEDDLFVKTNRSYSPDGKSFLQNTGLEGHSLPPAKQINTNPINIEGPQEPTPVISEAPQKTNIEVSTELYIEKENQQQSQGIVPSGIEYLNKQATAMYQLMGNTSLLMQTNMVDYYF